MVRTQYLPGQLPLFLPTSDWTPPKGLPDLRGKITELALDTETRDISLSAGMGPGWAYGNTRIYGVSIAWDESNNIRSCYFPIRGECACFEPDQIKRWIEDHDNVGISFIYHNAPYDIGCLLTDIGISIPRVIHDTTAMAVMVDENRYGDHPYSLDSVSNWLGIPGKDEFILNEAAAAYGYKEVKPNLWQLPAKYVGPYAEQDAVATLKISKLLRQLMYEENTLAAYQLEMDLIPMTIQMRLRGIRIDIDLVSRSRLELIARRDRHINELSDYLGFKVSLDEVNSPRYCEEWFTNHKVPFQRTPKSNQGQFQSDWMEKHPHYLPQIITAIRQIEMAQSKFLKTYLLDYAHKGRIHANINQFKGEEGGTRSHRFSYSSPPLQQMYSRPDTPLKEYLVEIIRGCFLPEEGTLWSSIDYSQQEFRLMVHFSELLKLRKADMAGNKYRENPDTDFHDLASELTKLERRSAKDVNFAKAFGAGVGKFALMTGMSLEESKKTMEQYDEELPFIKDAAEFSQGVASRRGYIQLIDGARSHFNLWEPAYRNWKEESEYKGDEGCYPAYLETVQKRTQIPEHPWYGKTRIVRAFAHKSWNRLIQGSAARQMKLAMRECYRQGLLPLIQMHDELGFPVKREQEAILAGEIMRDVVKLTVPMKVDLEYGTSWGTARKIKNKEIVYGATWKEAERLRDQGKWW